MTKTATSQAKKSQGDKFKETARKLGADEDEKHWEDRLKKVVGGKGDKEK